MHVIVEPNDRAGQKMNFVSRSAADLVHNKKSQNFRAWLHTALHPLVAFRLNKNNDENSYGTSPDEVKLNLEWVHGIRCHDTKRCLKYSIGREQAEHIEIKNI